MKKAQIQFMEMIFVLLTLVVIIFIGMFFYFSFSIKGIEEKGAQFIDIDATTISDSIIGLPELTCGPACVDTMKVLVFKPETDPSYYKSLFKDGKMRITLEKVYPPLTSSAVNLVVCDNINYYTGDCNSFIVYNVNKLPAQAKEIVQNTVSLYYPITNSYGFGLIKIEVYK